MQSQKQSKFADVLVGCPFTFEGYAYCKDDETTAYAVDGVAYAFLPNELVEVAEQQFMLLHHPNGRRELLGPFFGDFGAIAAFFAGQGTGIQVESIRNRTLKVTRDETSDVRKSEGSSSSV